MPATRKVEGALQNFVPPNRHQFRLQMFYATPERPDCASGELHNFPTLNFDADELEEYSTVLSQFQNQVETGEPSDAS